jgi:phosphate transport system permease protein
VESKRHPARHARGIIFWVLCGIALVIVVLPSAAIIIGVVAKAIPVLRVTLLTTTTRSGALGLQNAIIGTLTLGIGVLIVAGPIGILSGLYIAEFAPKRFGGVLRFFSEVLAGVPSIVIGYVGYLTLVVRLHWGFSLLGGILALSVLIIPYIIKITEVSFAQVPRSLREAAMAVGLTRLTTIRKVLLPPALPGIVSGLVLALAISTGETAPLLFTAGFTDANPSGPMNPVGYLTYVTYTDVSLPSAGAQALASASAAVTILLILFLILGGRLITARSRRMVARLDV